MALVTARFLSEDAWFTFARNKFSSDFDRVAFARDNNNYDDGVSFTIGVDGEDAAEQAFDISNNPSRESERDRVFGRRRSLSVGDLVEVQTGEKVKTYLCDSIGWLEVVE